MHVRRNWRPTLTAVCDHHDRVVDTNLSVHDLPGSVGESALLNRAEDAFEEVDRAARAIDNEIGRDGVVVVLLFSPDEPFVRLSLTKHSADVVPNQPVLIKIFSTVPRVKASCGCVGGINIHTDP